ncbi:RHS repeat-associated core domain-containing protein [Nonomuraea rhodomycinica]|uniref:Hint domain-containing protein n=1 Tax=Nonomuraea rhodomycinica TaxID=1712872 RepID=A0A7Y6IN80_9ACTN|nr:RHS repeat-associated core domain-containing protein [Nonomuraea rhodomycinica]NUW41369.1 hypothetical protein [Nonomuraea rhodomycinica]
MAITDQAGAVQSKYGWDPFGGLVSVKEGANAALGAFTDIHDDLVGTFSGTALSGSTAYNPYGEVLAQTGTKSTLGYQGEYTDPDTGKVNMHARWYQPGTGSFASRDTWTLPAEPSIKANRYTYVSGRPLSNVDPTGHKDDMGGGGGGGRGTATASSSSSIGGLGNAAPAMAGAAAAAAARAAVNRAVAAVKAAYISARLAREAATAARVAAAAAAAAAKASSQGKGAVKPGGKTSTTSSSYGDDRREPMQPVKPKTKVRGKPQDQRPTTTTSTPHQQPRGCSVVGSCGQPKCSSPACRKISTTQNPDDKKRRKPTKQSTIHGPCKSPCTPPPCPESRCGTPDNCTPGQPCAHPDQIFISGDAVAELYGIDPNAYEDPIINCDASRYGTGTCEDGVAAVDPEDTEIELGDPPQPPIFSCGTGNSFVEGTKVLMADGSAKPIENVKIGDMVLATDPSTGSRKPQSVTALIAGQGMKRLVEITIDTDGKKGDRTGEIVATGNHPFWIPALKVWIPAGQLQPGMWLQTAAGTYVQITAIASRTAVRRVHNLTIDAAHTYHVVAGDQAILVHNDNPADGDAWPGIVWRALAPGEDPALGLTARDPSAVVDPLSHVAGKRRSPWISTSKLPSVAFDKYNQGHGVVAIDLSKIPGAIADVSSGFPGKGRVDAYAKKDQEVLIHGYVPSDAIVGCWD